MIKERYWQKVIVISMAVHSIQGVIMYLTNTQANVFLSFGMLIICIAFIYKSLLASKKELSKQEK